MNNFSALIIRHAIIINVRRTISTYIIARRTLEL